MAGHLVSRHQQRHEVLHDSNPSFASIMLGTSVQTITSVSATRIKDMLWTGLHRAESRHYFVERISRGNDSAVIVKIAEGKRPNDLQWSCCVRTSNPKIDTITRHIIWQTHQMFSFTNLNQPTGGHIPATIMQSPEVDQTSLFKFDAFKGA